MILHLLFQCVGLTCNSSGEHAAMEAKLTEREAEVTAEYEVQTSQKRECNEMKSNVSKKSC